MTFQLTIISINFIFKFKKVCEAGTATAAKFLEQFVDKTPWVHMDIAGTAWGPKEPAYQPKIGATGVAVRLVYQLLENRI